MVTISKNTSLLLGFITAIHKFSDAITNCRISYFFQEMQTKNGHTECSRFRFFGNAFMKLVVLTERKPLSLTRHSSFFAQTR